MTGHKITRNRIIKSCRYCYEHKLKCDKDTPCSTCIGLKVTEQCTYGFAKLLAPTLQAKKSDSVKRQSFKRGQKLQKFSAGSIVYKSKYFYPFFTSSINDKILRADHYGQLVPSSVLTRNEITKFDKFASPARDIDDILALLPPLKETALSQVEIYFECVHPMIPVFSREKILDILSDMYESSQLCKDVKALDVLLVMAIFFCSAYAAVASGVIPDLLLCNKYYKAYKLLLDIAEFPLRPQMESLQTFLVVNFVLDPNMVDATAYSAMLVRMGQQLGLHKASESGAPEHKLLWNLLLYIEGSSSVVCGFSFFVSSKLLHSVPLPELKSDEYPIAYTIGRCKINSVFREVMELTSRNLISKTDLQATEKLIENLYDEINDVNGYLREIIPTYSAYFSTTLSIFLYRLHLRFFALPSLQSQEDKILHRTSNEITSVHPLDITGILEVHQNLKEEVVQLSLLLLFHTYKRLVQKDIDKFAWYTKGSTVMQYLFVVIKDLSQIPLKPYNTTDFAYSLQQTLDSDILEIFRADPVFQKFVLVEGVIGLMELKLASLWNNEDLYKFLLVKAVKEKVWQANSNILKCNSKSIQGLKQCTLFATGIKHLQNMKSINFEECLKNWESEKVSTDMERILTNWLLDFHGG